MSEFKRKNFLFKFNYVYFACFFLRHPDENDEVIMLREKTVSSFGRSTSPASLSLLKANASKSMLVAEWNAETPPYNCYSTTTDDDDFFTLGFRPQDEITTEL